jgi:hypothetical protein
MAGLRLARCRRVSAQHGLIPVGSVALCLVRECSRCGHECWSGWRAGSKNTVDPDLTVTSSLSGKPKTSTTILCPASKLVLLSADVHRCVSNAAAVVTQ